jgi:hypothetical protein
MLIVRGFSTASHHNKYSAREITNVGW